ncbi:hypothetical protein, partial [Exiguobacterium sp. 8H]
LRLIDYMLISVKDSTQSGNIIFGRNSFVKNRLFNKLSNVQVGQTIFIENIKKNERVSYIIEKVFIVPFEKFDEGELLDLNKLTLVTTTGHEKQLLIVQANLFSAPSSYTY